MMLISTLLSLIPCHPVSKFLRPLTSGHPLKMASVFNSGSLGLVVKRGIKVHAELLFGEALRIPAQT